MRKIALLLLAISLLFVSAFAAAEKADVQEGVYTIYNVTGEKVTSLTLTDNVTGESTGNMLGEDGLGDMSAVPVTLTLPASEDGNHRYTLAFVTESGYEGKFETLSIETVPISLIAADAMTGATQIAFKVPELTGEYTIYNTTGEKVTSVTITDTITKETSDNFVGEEGLAADGVLNLTLSLPANEDGKHRFTLAFVTESGYEGKFETLSLETVPISLLAADAMTGATQIAFKVPELTGEYTIYNTTGEKVTSVTITDNNTKETSDNFVGEEGLAADGVLNLTLSLPANEDGNHRFTLKFVTESGYEGKFETLSLETVPISLLSADAMTGATQIAFKAPEK